MPAPHNPQHPRHNPQNPGRAAAAPPPNFSDIRFTKPLDPELFNERALKAAEGIASGKKDIDKGTQLRRFYNELVLWASRVERQREHFADYLPFIRMLNAKAAYAEGRKLVSRDFVDLLAHTLREVNSAETLATCKLFWEAFMGFYKQKRND